MANDTFSLEWSRRLSQNVTARLRDIVYMCGMLHSSLDDYVKWQEYKQQHSPLNYKYLLDQLNHFTQTVESFTRDTSHLQPPSQLYQPPSHLQPPSQLQPQQYNQPYKSSQPPSQPPGLQVGKNAAIYKDALLEDGNEEINQLINSRRNKDASSFSLKVIDKMPSMYPDEPEQSERPNPASNNNLAGSINTPTPNPARLVIVEDLCDTCEMSTCVCRSLADQQPANPPVTPNTTTTTNPPNQSANPPNQSANPPNPTVTNPTTTNLANLPMPVPVTDTEILRKVEEYLNTSQTGVSSEPVIYTSKVDLEILNAPEATILTRMRPREREELCNEIYRKAKDQVMAMYNGVETADTEKIIFEHADRLLKAFIDENRKK